LLFGDFWSSPHVHYIQSFLSIAAQFRSGDMDA
jgi:hypothetical protein